MNFISLLSLLHRLRISVYYWTAWSSQWNMSLEQPQEIVKDRSWCAAHWGCKESDRTDKKCWERAFLPLKQLLFSSFDSNCTYIRLFDIIPRLLDILSLFYTFSCDSAWVTSINIPLRSLDSFCRLSSLREVTVEAIFHLSYYILVNHISIDSFYHFFSVEIIHLVFHVYSF